MTREALHAVERYLHQHIPITLAMGVTIAAIDEQGVLLSAPLEPNINHRNTVFGGSAATLAILAGWTLIHVRLHQESLPNRLVIQRSSVEYHRALEGTFTAFCPHPEDVNWQRFMRALRRRGRARLTLHGEIRGGEEVAGRFEGAYVAMARMTEDT